MDYSVNIETILNVAKPRKKSVEIRNPVAYFYAGSSSPCFLPKC
jgi:hypothetical protein